MSNLWWASAREQAPSLALSADGTADLLVIGGGFTGCAAALEAAGQGADVCLLEAAEIGHGGSGRNVGLVNAGLWLPPDTVVQQMGEEAGTRLIDILAEAPTRVFDVIAREGIDCEAVRNGTLHLAHAMSGLRDLEDRFKQGNRLGAPLQLLDAAETARRAGSDVFKGALWDPRAGTIQPLSYCRGLARAAVARGARVHAQSPVTSLTFQDGVWQAQANGHTVRATSVILATNAYHLGIRAPFAPECVPVSYSQFATAPLPEEARRRVLDGGEGCWDTALVMSSFRVDQAGRLIVGGIGNAEGPGAGIHSGWARRKLRQVYPDLADQPFEHAWRGQIAMTADHVPKIVAFGPSAYACFGYSGRGIGPGTVFGTETAKALLGGTDAGLPVAPISSYSERFCGLRGAYYEMGATMTHAIRPAPFIG